jgi:AraC-like DNA-binding protein
MAVGYKEYTSFARSFQRRFGLSPGKIRTQVRPARDREQSYIL